MIISYNCDVIYKYIYIYYFIELALMLSNAISLHLFFGETLYKFFKYIFFETNHFFEIC